MCSLFLCLKIQIWIILFSNLDRIFNDVYPNILNNSFFMNYLPGGYNAPVIL